jgi:hypothetical protein
MTLRDLNLMAGIAALTTLGVVGCADSPEPEASFAPSAAPSGYTAPPDPATETAPPAPSPPLAPPEIPSDGIRLPSEPIDPEERPPGAPPSPLPGQSPG